MADSMYCHACHHQWQRDSDGIECPQCQSASTEIVTPDDDPRRFHNPQSTTTPNPGNVAETQPTTTPSAPDHEMTDAPANALSSSPQDGNSPAGSPAATQQQPGSGPRPEFVLVFPPPVTLFTTVVTTDTHVPPPDAAGPRGPPVTTFFTMNVMPPMIPLVHRRTPQPAAAPPTETTGAPAPNDTADQARQTPEQQQSPQSETQPQPPHATLNGNRIVMPFTWLDLLFGSLAGLNPSNAAFGDAVYSQEALDRIISQLREAQGPGGAPPASQTAIDKLEVKELDEKMLGGETKTRCVICVDEMTVGEKASVLPCNHFFHGECVTPWLKQHNTCPVCRRSIEPETMKPGKAAEFAQDQAHQHAPSAQDCS